MPLQLKKLSIFITDKARQRKRIKSDTMRRSNAISGQKNDFNNVRAFFRGSLIPNP